MKKLLILFSFCSLPAILSAQHVCKGILRDSITGEGIEFANVGIIGKGVGTVTNEKGEYSFTIPDSLANERVKMSMLGYHAKTIPVLVFKEKGVISLASDIKILNEITISSKKTVYKILGNDTKTKRVSGGFTKNNLGAEMAIKLHVKNPQTQVRKLMFNINKNTLAKAPLFRVNIYKEDKEGYPGENILTQNIIIEPKNMTGFIELDLNPYNIFVSEDVFISIEWIKDLGDARGLYFSTKLVGSSTYFRITSQAKWDKTPVGIGLHAEVAY